jgi:hypothetical protein
VKNAKEWILRKRVAASNAWESDVALNVGQIIRTSLAIDKGIVTPIQTMAHIMAYISKQTISKLVLARYSSGISEECILKAENVLWDLIL